MTQEADARGLELWAGIECTRNRVGDRYLDQLELSGHDRRIEDLDLFAELGVRSVRYPVLWEHVAPAGLEHADWRWSDERLERLRELGITPIVGLVHHGSGPPHTNLLDPSFPEQLATFAGAVAERYPWVEMFTPVNEPLTTARFSGLYGHWYPHAKDHDSFIRALAVQCRAVILAMRAIRERTPSARLIQTEDLGKTHSTPLLAYQAEMENERRWLSFDLLCGRLDEASPVWPLVTSALEAEEIAWFRENPCPPDVLGINHYLSSERYLDEDLARYPEAAHGGNHRHAYADVLAARVLADGPAGPRRLLEEAWERYGLPIAVTEAHNSGAREEQLRWLAEVWDGAAAAKAGGADIRAVTVWSVFGAFGWASLVTGGDLAYESGVYDLRAPAPRPTLLVQACRALAAEGRFEHPVLASPGWWHRNDRYWYGRPPDLPDVGPMRGDARPLLVVGGRGTLGRAFGRLCTARGLEARVVVREQMDLTDPASIAGALEEIRPWAVVNATGFVRVDDAEVETEACHRANTLAPGLIAAACAERDLPLLTFSSDLVFDGESERPYVESDPVGPLNVYGRTKAEGERLALGAHPRTLVVRTSAFFGPWDEYNFAVQAVRALRTGEGFVAAGDATVSPTYVPDLVWTSLDLLLDGETGIWHLANEGSMAWAGFARAAARTAGADPGGVREVSMAELALPAPRPRWSVLGSERGWIMPSLEDALARWAVDMGWRSVPVGV
ncbi:MAG TPA: family 1 glycosylhydrolase [Actinomycetota bacterium]|nr:family 1 glycosylhydrolase [Actinomycetota bacterium]